MCVASPKSRGIVLTAIYNSGEVTNGDNRTTGEQTKRGHQKAEAQLLYGLEIQEPGSAEDPMETFESDHSFLPIQVGDLLNPVSWPNNSRHAGKLYRVTGLEHVLSHAREQWKHRIVVFIEELPNTREMRPGD